MNSRETVNDTKAVAGDVRDTPGWDRPQAFEECEQLTVIRAFRCTGTAEGRVAGPGDSPGPNPTEVAVRAVNDDSDLPVRRTCPALFGSSAFSCRCFRCSLHSVLLLLDFFRNTQRVGIALTGPFQSTLAALIRCDVSPYWSC